MPHKRVRTKASQKASGNGRNKMLHRFYEPLVLLQILDTVQGDHIPRQRTDASSHEAGSRTELRRRFLDALANICDHEKGGDSMTAIFVATAPLKYYIACNKPLCAENKVVPFLRSILLQLGRPAELEKDAEEQILARCVDFSRKRISTYKNFLISALDDCHKSSPDSGVAQGKLCFDTQSDRPWANLPSVAGDTEKAHRSFDACSSALLELLPIVEDDRL